MTSIRIDSVVRTPAAPPCAGGEEIEWLERCHASICEREPLLADDDILDLAAALWGLPRCQRLLPEVAAGLLLDDLLSPKHRPGRQPLADGVRRPPMQVDLHPA